MPEKFLNTRIKNKHDTEANWLLATNFTPLNGEIIIYDEDDNYDYKRIKIGNGETLVSNLPFIDKEIINHINDIGIHVTPEEKEAWSSISLDGYATETYVNNLYKKLNSNTTLGFYCIEDVEIITNDTSKIYPANSNVEIKFIEGDVFEIVPTSNNSILSLNAFPGALGTFYPWLEGVKQFSNILFDMNPEDMYTK